MIDNIHIFIIKHKNYKLKLLGGGCKKGLFNPKLSKKMKKFPKGGVSTGYLTQNCQKLEKLSKRALRRMPKNRTLIFSCTQNGHKDNTLQMVYLKAL